MYSKILLIFLLLASGLFAQRNKVRGRDLLPSAKDTIDARAQTVVSDTVSYAFAADTTAGKLLDLPEGRTVYWKGLDASSNPDNGGGLWVAKDSIHAENAYSSGYVKSHLTAGLQWIRNGYLQNNIITLEQYGTIGDGITDDTEAVRNAYNSEVPIIAKSGSTYDLTSTIKIDNKDVHSTISGVEYAKFTMSENDTMFHFSGYNPDNDVILDTLDKDGMQQNTYIVVKHPELYSTGDMIKMKSNKKWYNASAVGNKKGEMNIIRKIYGDTLELGFTLQDFYEVENDSELVTIYNTPDPPKVYLEGMRFVVDTNRTMSRPTVMFHFLDSPHIYKCRIDSARYLGFHFRECVSPRVDMVEANYSDRTGYGYGVNIIGCTGGVIERSKLYHCRHSVDIAMSTIPSHQTTVQFNESYDGNFSTHVGAENTIFRGNRSIGRGSGNSNYDYLIRSSNCVVINNVSERSGAGAFVNVAGGANAQIVNNVYNAGITFDPDSIHFTGGGYGSYTHKEENQSRWLVLWNEGTEGIEAHDDYPSAYLAVKNNTFYSSRNFYPSAIVGFGGAVDTVWNVDISGNTYVNNAPSESAGASSFIVCNIVTDSSTHMVNSTIRNNSIMEINGTTSFARSNVSFANTTVYDWDDPDGETSMKNGLWAYTKYGEMDSAETVTLETDIRGQGKVWIDTNYVAEGIAEFSFTEPAVITFDDTTGYSTKFSASADSAGRFIIYDAGAGPAIKNNLGDDRTVRIKIEYYK